MHDFRTVLHCVPYSFLARKAFLREGSLLQLASPTNWATFFRQECWTSALRVWRSPTKMSGIPPTYSSSILAVNMMNQAGACSIENSRSILLNAM